MFRLTPHSRWGLVVVGVFLLSAGVPIELLASGAPDPADIAAVEPAAPGTTTTAEISDPEATASRVDAEVAARFATLALECVHKEYPNKIAHVLASDADVKPPRELTPVFFGCYDWHSAVHGHWLLVRLARTFPEASFVPVAMEAIERSLNDEKIVAEVRYLDDVPLG